MDNAKTIAFNSGGFSRMFHDFETTKMCIKYSIKMLAIAIVNHKYVHLKERSIIQFN